MPVAAPPPDDARWMAMAIQLGERGLGTTAPNPSVGAVIVVPHADGAVVAGRGWTQAGGRPHAETEALARAGDAARGATLYVSLEPCSHHGRTPPCAAAIIAAGITRVVYGMVDPDPRVSGRGLTQLRQAGIAVDGPVLSDAAHWLTMGHSRRIREQRPFVQAKLAVSAEGLVPLAGSQGPVWVTGPAAKARTHLLRAEADAILTGIGTALADDPELTCRLPGMASRSPMRILLDSQLRLPLNCRLVRTAGTVPLWIVCTSAVASSGQALGLAQAGARIVPMPPAETAVAGLRHLMHWLAAEGITRVLAEPGPTLAKALAVGALVDKFVVYRGARSITAAQGTPLDALWPPDLLANYPVRTRTSAGDDIIECYRRPVDLSPD